MKQKIAYRNNHLYKKNKKEPLKFNTNKIFSLYHLAEFGRISFGIFHDLANILTSLTLNLEQVDKDYLRTDGNLQQSLKISKKLNNFLNTIKKQQMGGNEKSIFSINEAIEDCLEMQNYQLSKKNIEYILKKEKEIVINGQYIEFERIIFNIISNSIDSYDNFKQEKKKIIINTFAKDNRIHVEITDNGKGIKEKNLRKVFKPFFSTKKQKGLGIGLFASKNIAKKNFAGDIKIFSQPNRGTKVNLIIPKNIFNI